VRGVALSPDYANDKTLFHGTLGEGIYRSTTGGAELAQVTVGLPKAGFSVRRFAFSPDWANDQTIFVAGRAKGLFRSLDGGTNWTKLENGVTTGAFRELVIPADDLGANTIFAGSVGQGLFTSVDGGDSWTQSYLGVPGEPNMDVQGIAASPTYLSDGTVFVSTDSFGLFRSVDSGQTWAPVNTGLTNQLPRRMAISPAFADDDTLFVATHDWVWRSVDRGDTWSPMPGWVRVPDTHPQVFYTGAWGNGNQAGCHGTGVTKSAVPDDLIELEFHGDGVSWYASRSVDSGLAEVWLDGLLVATVDLYAPRLQPQQEVWSTSFRGVANHDLKIVVTGLSNPSASDVVVQSDGFAYSF
jgi:hypothetical protein